MKLIFTDICPSPLGRGRNKHALEVKEGDTYTVEDDDENTDKWVERCWATEANPTGPVQKAEVELPPKQQKKGKKGKR